MEEKHHTREQEGSQDTITGVYGRSRCTSNKRQGPRRRLEYSPGQPNQRKHKRVQNHQQDHREAGSSGKHTNESTTGTRTEQSQEQRAIKQQATSPGCGGRWPTQRANSPVQRVNGQSKRRSRTRQATTIKRNKGRAQSIQQTIKRVNPANETMSNGDGEA